MSETEVPRADIIGLTADIVSAHVSNNQVAAGELPALIRSIFEALHAADAPAPLEAPKQEPAVSIRTSVKPDHIVCLEDGAKLKMLKRYLRTRFGLSPDEYRRKWNLAADYPMVAPDYAETRRELAHQIGLGRKPGTRKATSVSAPEALKTARARVSSPQPQSTHDA